MIKTLKNQLVNIPSWHTNLKIIVIESDDRGVSGFVIKRI
jgi:hypothetical protein